MAKYMNRFLTETIPSSAVSSTFYWRMRFKNGRLGGVLATRPKGYGFKTRPRRWIFKGDKNPQHFLSDWK
jgi:hypothetical protein